ncbi:MAG TPA: iron-containing alcohol dehydrogenase, partial [Bacillota bacterium]|nr:iron-containing alcohol dehydrogenase [Bacillota bacterium]
MKINPGEIAIPIILEVGKDKMANVGRIIAKTGLANAVLFFGTGIFELVGEKVCTSLAEQQIRVLHRYEQEDARMDSLMEFAFSIDPKTEIIIGVGGGKILDI